MVQGRRRRETKSFVTPDNKEEEMAETTPVPGLSTHQPFAWWSLSVVEVSREGLRHDGATLLLPEAPTGQRGTGVGIVMKPKSVGRFTQVNRDIPSLLFPPTSSTVPPSRFPRQPRDRSILGHPRGVEVRIEDWRLRGETFISTPTRPRKTPFIKVL